MALEADEGVVTCYLIDIHSNGGKVLAFEIEVAHLLIVFSIQIRLGVFEIVTDGKELLFTIDYEGVSLRAFAFYVMEGILTADAAPLDWQRQLGGRVDTPLHAPDAFVGLLEDFTLEEQQFGFHVVISRGCSLG